jgi:hypothetical protein
MLKTTIPSPSKAKAAQSTKRWEDNLEGLSAKLHQIDKRYTTYRSRAKTRLRESSDWNDLSKEEQDHKLAETVDAVNREQEEKRRVAEAEWKLQLGFKAGSSEGSEGSEEDMDIEEWHGIPRSDDGEEWHGIQGSDDIDEGHSVGDEMDKQSDEDEMNDGDAAESTYDEDLHKSLSELRSRQGASMWRFLNEYETKGKDNEAHETPDDYAFGEFEESDSE